jgi:pimeloyl-ACP methyl ester carboxylesterase
LSSPEASRPHLGADFELVRSWDGTYIAARRGGAGDRTPVLVCNAVGANLAPWRGALVDVVSERPVIAWDQRGFFDSGAPASDRVDAAAHANDAVAVLEHYDLDRAVVVAWSNGARVALELARAHTPRVVAVALICGGYGHPFDRLVRNLELVSLLPQAAGVARRFSGPLGVALRALAARPELAGIIRQSGMVAPSADTVALVDLLRGVAGCDLGRLLETYEALTGGTSVELVRGLDLPALLVAGSRDRFTPLAMVTEMANELPGARLEVYEGATHYLPIEYPARLSADLRHFLAHL